MIIFEEMSHGTGQKDTQQVDNPRAMIADASRYEPRSNDTVPDFARHYGTSILPTRPRHPQDKAKAESAVQVVERWIMAKLRHQRIANHARNSRHGEFITTAAHMPAAHRAHMEWTPARLIHWG